MSCAKKLKSNAVRLKIRFYIMSLWLLFTLIVFLTIDIPICLEPGAKFIGVIPLIWRNVLPIISGFLALLSWTMSRKTEYEWKGVSNPPFMIEDIENENYEYLTFLTTYIIPLICIDLSDLRYVIVLGILLIIIGSIFVQMDLYYGNPTLALMGYKLYKVKLKNFDHEVTVISKSRLSTNMSIRWIKIDDYVWVAKENK